ncbi:MAG TPA: peptidoglycan editing factor PgeF [Candidatus Acidoferrales bacterium]|nr:peptidoglycan editing factor PgeF [Candidatus Acidoferrales bacterium]
MKKLRKPFKGVRRRRIADHASAGGAGSGWHAARVGRLTLLRATALEHLHWLVHGFSTRTGGASMLGEARVLNLGSTEWDSAEAVAENRIAFLRAVGAGRAAVVTLRQCHTDVIHRVDSVAVHPLRGDALITRTPGLLLAVRTADCVPLLLADRRSRAVASVHAGWRGTLARVAEKTLGRMKMEFDTRAEDVVAALGPAIGGCCYEVGPEVAQAYAAQFAEAREWFEGPFERLAGGDDPAPFPWLSMTPPGHDAPAPRVRLDLRLANRRQLEAAGVPAAHIVSSPLCTACRTDLLFSHRREHGRTGRMMAVIGIRE